MSIFLNFFTGGNQEVSEPSPKYSFIGEVTGDIVNYNIKVPEVFKGLKSKIIMEQDILATNKKKYSINDILNIKMFERCDTLVKKEQEEFKAKESQAKLLNQKTKEKTNIILQIKNYTKKRREEEKEGFVSSIAIKAEEIGAENTIMHLLPIISEQVMTDTLRIKILFLNQVTALASILNRTEKGYSSIKDAVLPWVQNLLEERGSEEIIQIASNVLADLTDFIKHSERMDHILKIILNGVHNDNRPELKSNYVQLLSKLAPKLGKELCHQFIVFEMMSLMDHQESIIRKKCLESLIPVCQNLETYFVESKLIPMYANFTKDKTWQVREAAAKIFTEINNLCSQKIRNDYLSIILQKYLDDTNKNVKKQARLNLGFFITSLGVNEYSKKFIDYYIELLDPKLNQDEEVIYKCAYTFPAVLKTLGVQAWNGLSKYYKQFYLKKDFIPIGRTLASSAFEIAKIIGPENSKILEPFVKKMISEPSKYQEVAIENLPNFLLCLSEDCREPYLVLLNDVIKISKAKWRVRFIISENIPKYCGIFKKPLQLKFLLEISINLIKDEVIEVINSVSHQFWSILSSSLIDKSLYNEALTQIKEFASSKNFRLRQAFVGICNGLLLNEYKIFELEFENILTLLIKEQLFNIKFIYAKFIQHHLSSLKPDSIKMLSQPFVIKSINIMQNDGTLQEYIVKLCDKEIGEPKVKKVDIEDSNPIFVNVEQIKEQQVEELEQEKRRGESLLRAQSLHIDEIDPTNAQRSNNISQFPNSEEDNKKNNKPDKKEEKNLVQPKMEKDINPNDSKENPKIEEIIIETNSGKTEKEVTSENNYEEKNKIPEITGSKNSDQTMNIKEESKNNNENKV